MTRHAGHLVLWLAVGTPVAAAVGFVAGVGVATVDAVLAETRRQARRAKRA